MFWSKYNYEYLSPTSGRLLFNYLSGALLDLNDDAFYNSVMKYKYGVSLAELPSKELEDYLIENAIICLNDKENEEILFYNNLIMRTQQVFKTLVIVPTLNCNLRCPYCYEGSNKSPISMDCTIVGAIEKYIATNINPSNTKLLALLWYGGEPLLEYETICELTRFVKNLEIPFYTDITTNGTLLTSRILSSFEDLNIKQIQLTFDGPRYEHDKKRFFSDQKGTFDLLWSKCEMLNSYAKKHNGFIVHVRINVDKGNQDSCALLYLDIKKHFPFLQPYMAPLKQYHSCSGPVNCFSNDKEVLEYMLSLYQKYGVDVADYHSVIRGMQPCMAESEGSWIIGPNGELYVCLNDVGDKNETAGNILNGNLNLSLVSKYRNGRLTAFNESCKECKMLWLCGGGCPNSQYRNFKYGECNEVCSPLVDDLLLNRYLDVRYEIQKKGNL